MLAGTITHRDRKVIERFLHHVYPVPNPYDTQGQFDRFYHLDLSEMPLDALRSEERRVLLRLDIDEKPPAWFLGRLEAVRQEIIHHRKSGTQEPCLPGQGLQQRIPGMSRHSDRGVPLAVRRIGVEGGYD